MAPTARVVPRSARKMSQRSGRHHSHVVGVVCLLVASSFVAVNARGNGRFPRAQRLIESATDKNLLALYGTYGLIVSSNAGASWNHVCEAATGTYTGEDPLLEILPDGKIVARTESALVKSGDSWCNWSTIRDGSVNQVQDITRGPTAPMTILALLGAYDTAKGFTSLFTQSTDAGTSWSAPKTLPLVQRGLSLDVAPSTPARVYVSGLDAAGAGQLLVSDNGGGNWLGRAITGTDSNSAPFLAAVSKSDENRLFVRTDALTQVNGIDTASDALILSTDAGKTWSTVIQRSAKLFGFALSPDESTLLVGYGDPVVAAMYVEPADLGIYRADVATILSDLPNASSHFEKIFGASVTCLRWTDTGLFACTSQDELGFEVGRAPNAAFAITDANPFTPLMKLPDVRPLPCQMGTNGYACYGDPVNGFASVCRVFKSSCDASAPPSTGGNPDSGVIIPSSGGATNPSSGGGSGGIASIGGTTGGGAGGGGGAMQPVGGAGNGAAGSTATASEKGSSCGCRTVGEKSPSGVEALLVAMAALVARRKRQASEANRSGGPRGGRGASRVHNR